MKLTLNKSDLLKYVDNQAGYFFPDGIRLQGDNVNSAFELALERCEKCFDNIILPGYHDENGVIFSHLHSDQYATFLYYFSNSMWKNNVNPALCSKIMYLNRALHSFFVSYKCSLPDIFALQHPVGTVIGNAAYSDYLVILQNVTVNTGNGKSGELCPVLGKGLYCGAGSKILGSEQVGDRVSLGVNSVVLNTRIPDDSIVINNIHSGKTEIRKRKNKECQAQAYFKPMMI